jgi:protein involved in ribonucleotide reduction
MTGNTHRFVARLGLPTVDLSAKPTTDQRFILVTPTYNFGKIPAPVSDFLYRNGDLMAGVIGGGDRVWGDNFARAARSIAEAYEVPLLGTFEKAGTTQEFESITERLRYIDD